MFLRKHHCFTTWHIRKDEILRQGVHRKKQYLNSAEAVRLTGYKSWEYARRRFSKRMYLSRFFLREHFILGYWNKFRPLKRKVRKNRFDAGSYVRFCGLIEMQAGVLVQRAGFAPGAKYALALLNGLCVSVNGVICTKFSVLLVPGDILRLVAGKIQPWQPYKSSLERNRLLVRTLRPSGLPFWWIASQANECRLFLPRIPSITVSRCSRPAFASEEFLSFYRVSRPTERFVASGHLLRDVIDNHVLTHSLPDSTRVLLKRRSVRDAFLLRREQIRRILSRQKLWEDFKPVALQDPSILQPYLSVISYTEALLHGKVRRACIYQYKHFQVNFWTLEAIILHPPGYYTRPRNPTTPQADISHRAALLSAVYTNRRILF
jgi:ribosomal protein S4